MNPAAVAIVLAAMRDVVLIGGGKELREAVTAALEPWELHVVASDVAPPPVDVPRATVAGRAIAQKGNAVGVVWVGDHALVVYDAETDQLVARDLSQLPPYDAPTAAAIALSVKTLLRSSAVAPKKEQIGAPPVEAPPAETPPAPIPPPPPAEPVATVEIGGAIRAIGGSADTRVGLGAAYWKEESGYALAIGLAGAIGPGLGLEEPRFRGHFDEVSVGASVRARLPIVSWLRVEPRVGGTLHVTRIDGVALPTAQTAKRSLANGSVDAGAVLDFVVSRSAAIGLDLGGAYVLRYQRYLVGSTSVLTLAPLQGSIGARIAVGIP
jgi:hypothetical protein